MTVADKDLVGHKVLGLLGVGRIDFFVLLRDTSRPGGLRGAVKSAEASLKQSACPRVEAERSVWKTFEGSFLLTGVPAQAAGAAKIGPKIHLFLLIFQAHF